jgi:hypothetical protein
MNTIHHHTVESGPKVNQMQQNQFFNPISEFVEEDIHQNGQIPSVEPGVPPFFSDRNP